MGPPQPQEEPRAKKVTITSSYNEFCKEQRPLMPTSCYSEREKLLGQRWKALSETERAKWGVHKTGTDSAAKNSWHKFYREQRPLLPSGLKNADKMRLLSEQWKAPSETAPAAYTSPYLMFCQEQRPLLPIAMCHTDKEKCLSLKWKGLTQAEKAKWLDNVHVVGTARTRPYYIFCKERRPLLASGLRTGEREHLLGEQWKALSEAERAKWEALSKAAVVPATTRPDTSASPAPLEPTALYPAPASATAPAAIAAPLLTTTASFANIPEMVLTGAVELMTAEEALEVMLNY